jgi:DnaK suppressor protein
MNHLTQDQLEKLKQILIKERNDILNELLDDENILNGTMDYVGDSGELAFDNLDKDLVSKISTRQKETLRKIEKALKKIEEGTYGVCEIGGKPISYQRLEILPYTTVCKEHMEN